jgi:deoxycytidine triphosphate deaminase
MGVKRKHRFHATQNWPLSDNQLFRCGVTFEATKTDPGYSGRLTFAITNNGNESFVFELGARVANIVFVTASGDLRREYGGQQEDRTSAGGRERQN